MGGAAGHRLTTFPARMDLNIAGANSYRLITTLSAGSRFTLRAIDKVSENRIFPRREVLPVAATMRRLTALLLVPLDR